MQIRYVSHQMPGWSRRRRGKGFEYRDQDGELLRRSDRQRCIDLVIPPAWKEVWICPEDSGHLQATGIDDLGRRQYIYHPQYTKQRELEKFNFMREMARHLPSARRRSRKQLAKRGVTQSRTLAVAFGLLDFGLFRIGSPQYEDEYGSYGLSTLQVGQLSFTTQGARFEFVGKSHREQNVLICDALLVTALRALVRNRTKKDRLLYFEDGGTERNLTPAQINDFLVNLLGVPASAKDFRTWHATVFAACGLVCDRAQGGREETIRHVVGATAQLLGNTPAVARESYIDPRIISGFMRGRCISLDQKSMPAGPPFPPRVERAVLDFLSEAA